MTLCDKSIPSFASKLSRSLRLCGGRFPIFWKCLSCSAPVVNPWLIGVSSDGAQAGSSSASLFERKARCNGHAVLRAALFCRKAEVFCGHPFQSFQDAGNSGHLIRFGRSVCFYPFGEQSYARMRKEYPQG